jgi:hypothetical protein
MLAMDFWIDAAPLVSLVLLGAAFAVFVWGVRRNADEDRR